ncbi:glycerophosphodiester phosphodiesterase family protein [Brachybacterium sp. YJGR34]|uniref:glycerophosphodiester phosphodiesterase n=1 Tax=Brachybacterium sp. YJGR34 TaxID=2059911 RepID=UPI000E0B47A6|nr:glycerophosphodiester phosphodiesterase family protein [Brachybacterium sp. YJGR34]
MKVYAHRGASIDAPENTLAAFSAALECGADGIELDCYRAKDGRIVVIHDDTLDRTTEARGPVKEWTSVELRGVNAGNGEHVPTLNEVLELAAGKLRVNIEIKDPDAADGVLEAVSGVDDLDWFISSGHWATLEDLHRRAKAPVYPLTLGDRRNAEALARRYAEQMTPEQAEKLHRLALDWTDALEFARRLNAPGLSIYEQNLTPEIISSIHTAGMEAWVWTINDPVRALEIAAMGADAICTDAPAEVLAARDAVPPRTGAAV